MSIQYSMFSADLHHSSWYTVKLILIRVTILYFMRTGEFWDVKRIADCVELAPG